MSGLKWIGATMLASLAMLHAAHAVADDTVRIGVLTDLNGPLSAYFGTGSVEAAKMAVEDHGGTVNGKKVLVVSADHQNKPDIGLQLLRRWYDVDGVDVVAGIGNSAVALGAQELTRTKNKVALYTGASTTRLTQKDCSPNSVVWGHDVNMFAHGVTEGILKEGGKRWFLIVVDYAFGQAMEAEVTKVIKEGGGEVVGAVRHPLNNADFSSFLLQAQASKAQVIGLLNSVQDLSNTIKQAREFGITDKQRLAALAFTEPDIKGLGLEAAQSITYSAPFYWDRTEGARAFSRRFLARTGSMPTGGQAAMYSAVRHYLKALQGRTKEDGAAVIAAMKSMPVDDFYAEGARVRVDGRLMKDVYLLQVKKPSESKEAWDWVKVLGTVPPEKAWAAPSTECALVKK